MHVVEMTECKVLIANLKESDISGDIIMFG
jgi:hypothetical protein